MAFQDDISDDDAANALCQGGAKSRKCKLHDSMVKAEMDGTEREELDELMDEDDGEAG